MFREMTKHNMIKSCSVCQLIFRLISSVNAVVFTQFNYNQLRYVKYVSDRSRNNMWKNHMLTDRKATDFTIKQYLKTT